MSLHRELQLTLSAYADDSLLLIPPKSLIVAEENTAA